MPGNPLGITLPTVGSTVGPDYATEINAALQTIIDDLEAKVTPDEILVNTNVDFRVAAESYAAINVLATRYENQSVALGGLNLNAVFSLNGELAWRDSGGLVTAITSSGAVAGAAGNITTTGSPAYASSGVELLWVGADLEYKFKAGAGVDTFANLVYAEGHIRNGANTMKMKSAVTTDYTITWPTTAPTIDNLITLDASGNISFSDSIGGLKTFNGAVTFEDNITADGDLAVAGTITMGVNRDVVVSGTGQYKHGDRTFTLPLVSGGTPPSSVTYVTAPSAHWLFDGPSSGNILEIPLPPLEDGIRLQSITVSYVSGATDRLHFRLKQQENVLPLSSNDNQLWDGTGSNGGTADSTLMTLAHTVDADTAYTLLVWSENGTAEVQYLTGAKFTVDWV